jgi:hypothetical protein
MQNQPEIERIVLHSRAVENRGGEGGGSYDLGYAMQRTVINVKKKKKDEARTKEGGGVI